MLDLMSDSDYLAAAGVLVLKEASGINVIDDFAYGREDVTSKTQGRVENIPTHANFKQNLQAKGFTNEEIVALASIEALEAINAPTLGQTSFFETLDNSLYKLVGSNSVPASLQGLSHALSDAELKPIVDQFAQDKKAFSEHLGQGFLKLTNLGHEELQNIENYIPHHPFYKYQG